MSKITIRYQAVMTVDVNLEKVEKYLLSKGWVKDKKYGGFGWLFKHDQHHMSVVLPTVDTVVDFDRRISDLLHSVAFVEQRQVPDVIADCDQFPSAS